MANKITILSPLTISSQQRALASEGPDKQPDLLYMDSVLVSTGENKNDDFFLAEEMWKARKSPVLKPVDWEHNTGRELLDNAFAELSDSKKIVQDNQIIGVMYNSYATLKDGSRIDENSASASDFSIPREFDIINEAVIYKYLFPKAAERIVADAKSNKLFVSMEAWFGKYDYKLGNKIVARNQETAFLDKHLRANGGEGHFEGQKISRVLRNIVFGGVGIVANPANTASVIKSVAAEEDCNIKNKVIASNIIQDLKEPEGMEKEKEAVQDAAASEIKSMEEKVAKAESLVAEKDKSIAEAKAEVEKLTKAIEDVSAAFSSGAASLAGVIGADSADKLAKAGAADFFKSLSEILAVKEAKAKEVEAKLADITSKVAAMEAEKVAAARGEVISKLLAEFEFEAEAAAKRMEKMIKASEKMDDSAFAAFIEDTRDLLASAKKMSKKKAECMEDEEEMMEEKTECSSASNKNEGVTDATILDNVKTEASVPAGKEDVSPPVDLVERMKSLANELLTVYNKKG